MRSKVTSRRRRNHPTASEPRANQTLREKLRREHGVALPDAEAVEGELDLAGLFAASAFVIALVDARE